MEFLDPSAKLSAQQKPEGRDQGHAKRGFFSSVSPNFAILVLPEARRQLLGNTHKYP